MLVATELLKEDERRVALAAVPWHVEVRRLTGEIFGALKNQAVDLIDAALGPNHARAALVALYEGVDLLLESTIDLADSVARQRFFSRVIPMDPLGDQRLENPEEVARVPLRFSRYAIEDAATRVVTAGDHMANAHVRLAWEANAATHLELEACGFNPEEPDPRSWIGAMDLRKGIDSASRSPLSVFRGFAANDAFREFLGASESVRAYRHAVIHRARPDYSELPALGRTTHWTKESFSIRLPLSEKSEAPTLEDYRRLVGGALVETLSYARLLWDLCVRWLRTLDVDIIVSQDHVTVRTSHGGSFVPRERRDPGAFAKG